MDVLQSFTRFQSLFIFAAFINLISCGGGTSEQTQTPPVNRSPLINSASEYIFDENLIVEIAIQANDPDGDPLTYSLENSLDSGVFTINSHSGLITAKGVSTNGFDFETPRDINADNIYELSVIVSDGVLFAKKNIGITINDISGPLVCSGSESSQIFEGVKGAFHTLTLSKPDAEFSQMTVNPIVEISRQSDGLSSNDIFYTIDTTVVESRNVATIEFGLFAPVNAELHGNLRDNYTFELQAKYENEIVICSFEVEIVDVVDEVQTGIKVSGEEGEHVDLKVYSIGDINNDGVNDLFLNSMKFVYSELGRFNGRAQLETPEFHGYVIDGRMIQSDIKMPNGKEIVARSIDKYVLHKMSGWYPSLGVINSIEDFTGYELIPEPIGDIDGNGKTDLLVTLRSSEHASNNAFVERPLAFVIWGETLLKDNAETNLNTIVPSQGLIIEGMGGRNRTANMTISGDFDGDGLADIAVSVPQVNLRDSEDRVYSSQLFIVFGDHIKNRKAEGLINLLDDSSDPNKVFHLSSLVEDSNVEFRLASPFAINQLQVLGDINGDGGEELLIGAGEKQFRVGHSIIVKSQLFMQDNINPITLTNDIRDEYLYVIEYPFYDTDIMNNTGDIDNDGVNDPLITTPSFFPELNGVRLIKGSTLLANTTGQSIVAEKGNDGVVIFNTTDNNVFDSASFIDDLDNDGRDDLVFSYYLGNSDTPNASVSIVLAKALDEFEAGAVVMLDQIPDGLILELKNTSLENRTSSFSVINDLDGDSIAELGIHPAYPLIEVYILPSKDIIQALKSGQRELDIESLFRNF
ncbi:cadherin repeat domain-containing protein [Paraglaciecola sp. 25GB23A]|uniref:cadherin repeat domain-containing protein n=1 Tax=Paraglaciecola sp. 25GB23A TaxID=3156068 RepID=UPI0032AFF9EE